MQLDRDFISDFSKLKRESNYLSRLYNALGDPVHAGRSLECASSFLVSDDGKFTHTFFCKDRFCPICAKLKSRYLYGCVRRVAQELISQQFDFVFLTLTVPNVPADMLKVTLDRMQKAFRVMFHHDRRTYSWGDWAVGMCRNTEITYNQTYDTYHPHYHCLIAVDHDYFTNPAKYKSQGEILDKWRECYGDDTIWEVHITRVRSDLEQELASSAAEVSKYAFCLSDLLDFQVDEAKGILWAVRSAMFGRPQYRFYGLMKKLSAELNDDEVYKMTNFIQDCEKTVVHSFSYSSRNHRYYYGFSADIVDGKFSGDNYIIVDRYAYYNLNQVINPDEYFASYNASLFSNQRCSTPCPF